MHRMSLVKPSASEATKPIYLMRKLQILCKAPPPDQSRQREREGLRAMSWQIRGIVFIPPRTSLGSARGARLLALL